MAIACGFPERQRRCRGAVKLCCRAGLAARTDSTHSSLSAILPLSPPRALPAPLNTRSGPAPSCTPRPMSARQREARASGAQRDEGAPCRAARSTGAEARSRSAGRTAGAERHQARPGPAMVGREKELRIRFAPGRCELVEVRAAGPLCRCASRGRACRPGALTRSQRGRTRGAAGTREPQPGAPAGSRSSGHFVSARPRRNGRGDAFLGSSRRSGVAGPLSAGPWRREGLGDSDRAVIPRREARPCLLSRPGSAVPHRCTCAAAAMRVGRVGKGTTTSGNTNVGSPVILSFGKPQALPFAFCDWGGMSEPRHLSLTFPSLY